MRFNLSLIFAGLLFFFNPCVNMLDLLPDFIGAILIMTGLSKMYMYNANFEDAKKSAKYLLWISVLKLVLCIWTNSGHRDYTMPFTFITCVLEVIFMISFFKSLYLGVEYTLMRADSEKHVKAVNEAFTMSFIYTIGAKVLEFLPHVTDIAGQNAEFDLSAGASFRMSAAQMKVYVYIACLVFWLILGIIYVFVISKAWIKIIGDKNYAPYLKEKYDSYVELDREAFMASKIGKIYFLVTASFIFFFDFYVDAVNLVPNFIGIILMTGALFYLCKYAKTSKAAVFATGICALTVSVVKYLYMHSVHLGINHIFGVETYNYKEFSLLESKESIYFAAIFALLEFALTTALCFLCFDSIRKLFGNEKRSVALPMLSFAKVLASLAFLSGAVSNVVKTVEGHLATNEQVRGYVQNKAYIYSEKAYNDFMKNPLIAQYEKVSSVSYILVFLTAVLCAVCLLYMIRIRRFTDGVEKQ